MEVDHGTQLAPRIVECLVQRAAGGVQPLCQDVDWDIGENHGAQHFSLVWRKIISDGGCDASQKLAGIKFVSWVNLRRERLP
jgi:hypothetical protein